MKKIYFLLLVGLMLSTFVPAQVNNYLFAGSSGTFTSLVGGTLSTAVGDDGTQTSIPIGFTFMYNGTTFTTFGISTNGAMQLGATAPGFSNALVSNTNVIAPLWDDNNMTGGTITYATTGAVGARILTIEWTNMHVGGSGSTTNPTITLQVLLYEANGMVQIIYGATSGALLSTTASIGISGAVGNFLSVTPLSPPNTSTVSSVTENSTISSAVNFPSGTTYTFTPPPACVTPVGQATGLVLTTISSSQINGSFTPTAADGYLIVRYPAGSATTIPVNATTYTAGNSLGLGKVVSSSALTTFSATGLAPITNYDFYVYSYNNLVCSGAPAYNVSSPTTGSQITNPIGNIVSTGVGGLWSAPATWVGGIVPDGGDNATIVDGATVTIDMNPTVTNLTVGGGASGILEFEQTTARTLTVSGNALIGSGATFRSNAAGTVITHALSIAGNLTNNGTIDFSTNTNTAGARITFTGAADASFDCSGATLTDLQQTSGITLNKGTSNAPTLNFTPGVSGTHTVLGANAVGFLTITNGTFKINGTNTFSNPVFNTAAYIVAAAGGIWLNNANATIVGLTASPTMSGLLRMTSGVFNVGTSAGNAMGGATTSNFIIEGGTMNFSGRLLVSSAAPCSFNMSAGIINVTTVGNASSASPGFGFTSTSSFFTMSGGTINLVQASTGATPQDYQVSSVPNISGGTLNIGTAATATNFNFRIQGAIPSVIVDNTTNAKTATLSASTIVYGDLTINTGTSWNHNATTGFTAQIHGNVVNNGSIVGTAASSRFDFISVTNTARAYSGTGTFGTAAVPFAGVGVGLINTGNVTLSAPILANRYNLFRGTFINSSAQITIGAPANVTTQVVQRGSGGSTAGAFDSAPTFNIGTGGLVLIYAAATTMTNTGVEIPASRSVFQVSIGNLNGTTLVGGPLAITGFLQFTGGNFISSPANLPTVTSSATGSITGFSAASYVVGPLARTFLASLAGASTYDFPVGTATTYNNIQMQPTTTASASLAVAQWQASTGPSGGTSDGATITSLDPVKFWSGQINANAASFTSTLYKITDGGLSANSRMAQSATQAGVYAAISPAPVASVLTSTARSTLNFIQIGSIGTTISGVKTICASGCDYTSLTAAGGAFADINSKVVNGDITLQIAGDIIIEDGTNVLNEFTSPHTLLIKPTGVPRAVSGTATAGLIRLNGADRVIIDGSLGSTVNTVCPAVSASRDLTITNTNAGSSSAVVWIQTALLGPNPAQNNTVMNCNIVGTASLSTGTLIGIGSGSSTLSASSLGTNNHNINIINNNISKTQIGIYSVGISAASKNQGSIINQNLINTLAPNNVTTIGIMVGFLNNGTISGNNVSGMAQTSFSFDASGINVGFTSSGFSTTSPGTQECTNMTITNNVIGSVVMTGTGSAVGLGLAASSLGTNLIANNTISGVDGNGTFGDFSSGLVIGGAIGSVTNVYNNTVSLQGTITGTTAASQVASCLSIIASGIPPVIDIKNNIFSNTQAGNAGATARFTAITTNYGSGFQMSAITSNNNDLYAAGAGPGTYAIGQTVSNTVGPLHTTLANWQAATGKDAASKNVLPVFVSTTDLHLSTAAGANWCLNGTGSAVSVTDDIDCQVRNNPPDMGADEFTAVGTADIATPASQTVCSANAITTIVLSGGAISYSWTRDNTVSATGIAASGTGNIGGTLTNITTSPVTVTFTITPLNANGCASPSGTFTTSVLVNPTATAVATPASQTICSATAITTIAITGNAVAGVVYNWTRDNTVAATGIATSGAGDISGTLTNTTTAPVTVTFTITPTANSCAGAAITATVLVNPTATAVATPASQTVCSASPITTIALTGNAVAGVVYNWTRDNTVAATGIATSGAGDISGTLTNTTTAPVTVTFTITPTANGCAGAAITATVLVNPTATAVATPASQTVCSATAITTIVLSGNAVAGVVYNWTRDNTVAVTGIAASGAGDISGTLTNTTTAPITVTFTITPTANGCAGAAITATVLVNPTPTAIATPASQTVCSGTPISTIAITGNAVSGVVYNWTRDNTVTATGIAASGAGDITGTLTNATASAVTVTFTITPTANGCPGTPITATVIVNALPVINSTQVEPTTCASADGSIDITVSGAAGPYTYAWTGSGVIPINEDQINLTVGSYSVTVTAANGCTATANFALAGPGGCSICPTIPNLTTVPSGSACAGNNVIFTASGLTDMGTTYGIIFKYSVAALANPYSGGTVIATVPNGSLTSGQTIATANYASIPAGTYNVYAILTPTPVDPVCRPAALVNLSIGAMPDVNQPADQAVCNTTTTAPVNFTGSVPGTIFNWINNNASIGLAASGTGNIASFTATNASNAPVVATITVTPTLVSTGASNITNFNYTGTLQNWTVPVGVTSITINAAGAEGGLVTSFGGPFPGGKGATMTGTFSVTPGNTLNIIVGGKGNPDPTSSGGGGGSGVNLGGTALIVAGGGAGIDYQEPSYAGINAVTTNNGVIGSNSGGVGGAAGTDGGDIVYGTAISRGGRGWNFGNNGSFGLNGVSSQTTTTNGTWGLGGGGGSVGWGDCNCGGGGGGYSGGGSGNINASGGGGGSFNSGTAQVNTAGIWTGDGVVSISYFSTITCTGTPKTFTITVNPTPNAVATPASQTICSGTNITTIALTSAVSGTTYNWTRDNSVTVTGIAASGGGNISGLLTNTTAAPITVTFTITPTANGCPGAPITATVLVNPTPNAVATPASQTICSAATITSIVLSGNVAGTVYNWSRDNSVTVTGIAASGTGNISGSLTNTTNAPVTVTFTITPTANGCLGAAITATVLVNPTPNAIATPVSQFVCSGNPIAGIILSGNVAGTVYNWTRDNIVTVTGIAASGAGNISGTFINTTAAPITVTFTITPTANGCPGAPITATVLVNPLPAASISYTGSPYCSGDLIALVTRTGTVGGTYSSTPGLTINAVTGTVTPNTSTPGIYTVTYFIAASGGCVSFTTTTTITITQNPNATIFYSGTPYCQNAGTANVTRFGTPGGTYSSTAGLIINASTGAVNLAASTPGTYIVSYTIAASGGCGVTVTTTNITITVAPVANISYTGSPYCSNAGTATVIQTGTTGGTYSSTVGLSINSVTGAIALGSSIPGSYTVTYTIAASGGCAVYATTTTITISALPAATISYAGSPYCQNAGTVSVTRTGTAGGTYSSTVGLTLNASTGDVNIATSTTGIYTVTYTLAAGGGCPVVTSTTSITITTLPSATISYAGNPYCQTAGTAIVTRTGTAGGVFSSTAGLTLNASTGDVTLGTSTPGTYTVTYTLAAGGGCPAVTATASITVNSLSTAATTANTSAAAICGPGTVSLSVTGGSLGSGASWKWYSGSCGGTLVGTGATLNVTVNNTTTYFVRAEGTCNTTTCASVTITVNVQPTISLTATAPTSLFPYQTSTLTATVSPSNATNTTVWYRNGNVIPGATGLSLVAGVDALGLYTVRTTTTAGCTALSNSILIKDTANSRMFITPNPNNGQFKVLFYAGGIIQYGFNRRLLIFAENGQKVFDRSYPITGPWSSMDINARHLPKGIYVVMLADAFGNEVLATGRVVIQ